MKKNICLLLLLGIPLTWSSCTNKESPVLEISDLIVDKAMVALTPGKSMDVNIKSGNGEYSVVSSDKNVAKASISGNVITITATTTEERANAIIVITDKMFKRTSIEVEIAKIFDLALNVSQSVLEMGVAGKDELEVEIETGNFGYEVALIDNSSQYISVNTIALESSGKFTIKAIAAGLAKVKVTDALGKEAFIELTISSPTQITFDKSSITIDAVQKSEALTIETGNGDYQAVVENALIAKASIKDNVLTIVSKKNGTTNVIVTDQKGQTAAVSVVVNGPAHAMNLSDRYFCFANFGDIAVVDESIKKCQQITFEITCKMDGYRGLQTFMGLEGNLIIRGKNDDYKTTHPIQITGLGDKIMLESTKSFNLDEWMNIALVVDCSKENVEEKYKLYINGVQDALKIINQSATHNEVNLASSSDGNRFEIGRAFGQDWRAMKGTVSEARIWTVARTAQQIKDNMCELTEADPSGLLARWDFTAGIETNYIQDISGGEYETNLIIADAKIGGSYSQVTVPSSVFVDKGCPN